MIELSDFILVNALAGIRALLNDRVEVDDSEDMTVYDRILDAAKAYRFWSDLAMCRLM